MYYTLIGTSAQIVLAQRSYASFVDLNALIHPRPDRTYAITKKNKWVAAILYTICAVQFSAGVYEFIWSALSTSKYLPSIVYARPLELRSSFLAANISPIPLDTYRLCLPTIERKSSLVQMVLSLAFGRHSFAPLNLSIPHIDPPGRSYRPHSFFYRPHTDPNHQIDASDEWVQNSRHSQ